MTTLTRAHRELYRRTPDEMFGSLEELSNHCQAQMEKSADRWHKPEAMLPQSNDRFSLTLDTDGQFGLNDWSFTQLCQLARVNRDTVNRLTPATARQVFLETLPDKGKPLQFYTTDGLIRSIHGAAYTRLYNADLLDLIQETAEGFEPPQTAQGGGSGLYAGEQDMFVFLIDPFGWVEIEDQAFAPGFFVWNSEVGRRSVGIQTFWFQAVCSNHLVWDAVEMTEFTRKHTAHVHDSLEAIREIIASLTAKRDARKDGFARVLRQSMNTTLGDGNDADEALKALTKHGISQALAKKALDIAKEHGRFTIFSVVDALTRISGESPFAGARFEADQKAGALLQMAA
ncbi:DUF932 domain-containing protein [candidate division KSB1 bacterium]|nr:DUF932 domain-containing protein [candidate division KSB1 bacterium]